MFLASYPWSYHLRGVGIVVESVEKREEGEDEEEEDDSENGDVNEEVDREVSDSVSVLLSDDSVEYVASVANVVFGDAS